MRSFHGETIGSAGYATRGPASDAAAAGCAVIEVSANQLGYTASPVALASSVVDKAGDTMTGGLTAPSFTSTGQSTFGTASTYPVDIGGNGAVGGYCIGNVSGFAFPGTPTVIPTDGAAQITSSQIDFGMAMYRWATGYFSIMDVATGVDLSQFTLGTRPSAASNPGMVIEVNDALLDNKPRLQLSDGSGWHTIAYTSDSGGPGGSGTVTSVGVSVPTGLTVSGSPVTTSGTIAIGLGSGRVIPLQSDLDAKVTANGAITASTKTKISYDAKGLVTAGTDATTADIADSTNKRYVTDAQLTVLGNTSGINTGDQDLSAYATLSYVNGGLGSKASTSYVDAADAILASAISGKANVTHAHAWADITSGKPTTLAGYGITDGVTTSDARLSDARTPTSHPHGNISNAGAIGSTSGVPIITGASGVLQAGSFGSASGTFCQGNDARLSDARTPTAHNHSASEITSGIIAVARLGSGTPSGTNFLRGDGTWATPSGSGGGNLIADLAETSITGTATLAVSTAYVCSGTTSDYTITLPTAVGNAGKMISVRMSNGLTKLVTLDGHGTETIDGATSRVMWAGESAVLISDGAQWCKIAGRSIPFYCQLRLGTASFTAQAIANTTITKVNHTEKTDPYGIGDLTNDLINIPRSSKYEVAVVAYFNAGFTASRVLVRIYKNGTTEVSGTESGVANSASFGACWFEDKLDLSQGDTIHQAVFQDSGASRDLYGNGLNRLTLAEIVQW